MVPWAWTPAAGRMSSVAIWFIASIISHIPRDQLQSLPSVREYSGSVRAASRIINDLFDGVTWLRSGPSVARRSDPPLFQVMIHVDHYDAVSRRYRPRGLSVFQASLPIEVIAHKVEAGEAEPLFQAVLLECIHEAEERWKTPLGVRSF